MNTPGPEAEPPRDKTQPDEKAPQEHDAAGEIVPTPGGESGEEGGLLQFVTPLTPIEQQVGVHVINALQHPETVAVVTTVAMGRDAQQHIISIGLDQELMEQVQELLHEAKEERTQRVPCVGFHCVLQDREERKQEKKDKQDD